MADELEVAIEALAPEELKMLVDGLSGMLDGGRKKVEVGKLYAEDASGYFRDILKVKDTWAGEDEILKALPLSVRDRRPIYVASGHACFGSGTKVLMADGSVKAVEDVARGDRVMGDDSTPRNVLGIISGREMLYKVTYYDGTEYVHNASHILCLRQMSTHGRMQRGQVVEVLVSRWLSWGSKYRRRHCGFRVPVEYAEKSLLIPPYIFGLWLGDGCESSADFSNTDAPVISALSAYAPTIGCAVSPQKNGRNFYLRYRGVGGGRNPFLSLIHQCGVFRNKHIPKEYMTSSRYQRLELLAGLIDSDGNRNYSGGYEITQKRRELAAQIAQLVRSLGMGASISERSITGKFPDGSTHSGRYFRVYIWMSDEAIPVRIVRKRSSVRSGQRSPLSTAIRSITPIGEGNYYGFQLDGNHRFLGADCMVLHNCGKDFISGGIPLWFQETRYPAKTILTGPTFRQVIEITWAELVMHYARAGSISGKLLTGKLDYDPQHFVLAFTTGESSAHIGKAQGFHSKNICIIVTEAQAVSNSVRLQLDGLMASGNVLFIAIGNPLISTGWFADGIRNKEKNIVIHLDCEDSPNVKERRQVIPGLVSWEWVEEKRKDWYDQDPLHPLWWTKVKGQLPPSAVDTIFTMDMLEKASLSPPRKEGLRISVGLDPAEFGDDLSAFCVLNDGVPVEEFQTSKQEPTDTAARAALISGQFGVGVICVDSDGGGFGIPSILRQIKEGGAEWEVEAIHGSGKSTDATDPNRLPNAPPPTYFNRRAELWFHAKNELILGHVAPPKSKRAWDELCSVRYELRRGQIILTPKVEIKSELGRSPDEAEAWILAVWGLRDDIYPLRENNGRLSWKERWGIRRRNRSAMAA